MATSPPDRPEKPVQPSSTTRGRHVNTVNVSGTHVGSQIVAGVNKGRTTVTTGGHQPDEVTALRRLIEESRDDLVEAAANDEERTVVGYELRKLLADLDGPSEQAEPVPSRWQRIVAMLTPVAAAGSGVAQAVTDVSAAVESVFGTS